MRFLIVVFLCFLVMLGACKKEEEIDLIDLAECESGIIDLGLINLEPESMSFLSYTGTENIYFRNDHEEVKFEPLFPPNISTSLTKNFTIPCKDGAENEYIYRREQHSVSHRCEDLNLQYYVNLFPWNSSEFPLFVDQFSIVFHRPPIDNVIDTAIHLWIVPSFKGNEASLKDEIGFSENYQFLEDTTLLNKTFFNVYKVSQPKEEGLTELYYNKEFGIVAFKDLDFNLWVFDRFE